jgi:hypothetical protein
MASWVNPAAYSYGFLWIDSNTLQLPDFGKRLPNGLDAMVIRKRYNYFRSIVTGDTITVLD